MSKIFQLKHKLKILRHFDFLIKDTLKAYDNFRNKQQKCIK